MKNFINYARWRMNTMINDNNKDTWCVNAEHALAGNNDGTTKICCMIDQTSQTSMRGNLIASTRIPVLGVDSIEDHFNRQEFVSVRQALGKGQRHPACTHCWQEEDANRKSKRQRDNERYLHEMKWGSREEYKGLTKIELNLGNLCNIKCRTCHPAISSKWMKEYHEVYEAKNGSLYKDWSETMKRYHQSYDNESPFWPDIETHLSTLKQFDFYGGEPFLSEKMWKLLSKAVDKGYSKDIELHYNTNGTTWPDAEIEAWKDFKQINLSFSIDGIGEQFEYMRFPAKWDAVERTLEKARNFRDTYGNMQISWCVTLSTLNIYNLPEVLDEYYTKYSDMGMYLNLVHGPSHYNIDIIPDRYKDTIISKLESIPKEYESVWFQLPGIINFIKNGTPNENEFNKLFETTEKHDEYRDQSFSETFPEYSDIIGYDINK